MNPASVSTCARALRWLAGELAKERHPLAHVPAQVAAALFDVPVGLCRLCGEPLPPALGRGRPRVRCESCSPPRCKVSANPMMAVADSPTLTDEEEGAA